MFRWAIFFCTRCIRYERGIKYDEPQREVQTVGITYCNLGVDCRYAIFQGLNQKEVVRLYFGLPFPRFHWGWR